MPFALNTIALEPYSVTESTIILAATRQPKPMQPEGPGAVIGGMRLALLLLLSLSVGCSTASTNPVGAFRFRPERVPPVGTVLQYVKSNLDGSKPALVSLYFAGPQDIEVSKSEAGVPDSTDVKAHLDYKRFTADRLDTGVLSPDGTREQRATLSVNKDELLARFGEVEQRLTANVFPLHLYNFDLMGLNVMLPHLRNPRKDFTIAFAEPTFGEDSGVIELRGRATAAYVDDITVDGRNTHRYRLSGAGLAGAQAILCVDAADGLIDLVESPLPTNPDWDSYRLSRLGKPQLMSRLEWDAFKRAHVGIGVGVSR